jgi:hypothetical protein
MRLGAKTAHVAADGRNRHFHLRRDLRRRESLAQNAEHMFLGGRECVAAGEEAQHQRFAHGLLGKQ